MQFVETPSAASLLATRLEEALSAPLPDPSTSKDASEFFALVREHEATSSASFHQLWSKFLRLLPAELQEETSYHSQQRRIGESGINVAGKPVPYGRLDPPRSQRDVRFADSPTRSPAPELSPALRTEDEAVGRFSRVRREQTFGHHGLVGPGDSPSTPLGHEELEATYRTPHSRDYRPRGHPEYEPRAAGAYGDILTWSDAKQDAPDVSGRGLRDQRYQKSLGHSPLF
jgi:hypothetical protein